MIMRQCLFTTWMCWRRVKFIRAGAICKLVVLVFNCCWHEHVADRICWGLEMILWRSFGHFVALSIVRMLFFSWQETVSLAINFSVFMLASTIRNRDNPQTFCDSNKSLVNEKLANSLQLFRYHPSENSHIRLKMDLFAMTIVYIELKNAISLRTIRVIHANCKKISWCLTLSDKPSFLRIKLWIPVPGWIGSLRVNQAFFWAKPEL